MITRRSLLLQATVLLAAPRLARAYLLPQPVGCVSSSYTGPGDILSLTSFWGVRAYNQAYAAACGNALNLRRASDNATMTAKVLTNGDLDVASIVAWAGGSNIFVSQAYDQTGAGNHVVQTTSGNQPQLFTSGGPNNKPYVEVVNNTNGQLATAAALPNGTSPSSMTCVANRVSGTDSGAFVNGGGNNRINGGITTSRWGMVGGGGSSVSATTGANNNTWIDAQGSVVTGGTSRLKVSGLTTNTATGVVAGSGGIGFGWIKGGTTSTFRGCEAGVALSTQWTTTDETNMSANQRGYYAL